MSETRRKLPSELRKEQDDRDAELGAALRAALQAIHRGSELRIWRSSSGLYVEGVDTLDGQQDSPTYDALAALLRSSPPEGPPE